jgi:hypothetical protein
MVEFSNFSHTDRFFLMKFFDFTVVFSICLEPSHLTVNMHGAATEPVNGDGDNMPDAHGKGNSRKDPVQLTDVAGQHHLQCGNFSVVLAITTRQISYMKCSS